MLGGTAATRGAVPLEPVPGEGPLDVRPCPDSVPTAISGESAEPVPKIWCGEDADRFADFYNSIWSASGLTGVCAEENTRAAIYDAFRRKEAFATGGPRVRVRFFGGYDLADVAADAPDMVERADAAGVPMGGDIEGRVEGRPTFLVRAARDAHRGPIFRRRCRNGPGPPPSGTLRRVDCGSESRGNHESAMSDRRRARRPLAGGVFAGAGRDACPGARGSA